MKYTLSTLGMIATTISICLIISIPSKPTVQNAKDIYDGTILCLDLCQSSDNDLEFLLQELQGKDIVVLGEALHYDGSTFLIKTELVKFLHEQLGFNTILFESGEFDMYNLQRQLEINPEMICPESAIWSFWSETIQINELWDYICETWHNYSRNLVPLSVGGIDCQYSGNISDSLRFSYMKDMCDNKHINMEDVCPTFADIMPDLTKYILDRSYFQNKIRRENLEVLNQELYTLSKLLGQDNMQVYRYIDNIRNRLLYTWNYPEGHSLRTIWRDSLMTDNFIQYKKTHPNEKIIVWTSNMHASKTGALNYKDPDSPIKNFGNRLYSIYSDSLYVILFHNWAREANNGGVKSFLKTSSVEHSIHTSISPNTKYKYLFFSEPSSFGRAMFSGIMEGEFICEPGEMCDALIYEDYTEFIRYEKYDKNK